MSSESTEKNESLADSRIGIADSILSILIFIITLTTLIVLTMSSNMRAATMEPMDMGSQGTKLDLRVTDEALCLSRGHSYLDPKSSHVQTSREHQEVKSQKNPNEPQGGFRIGFWQMHPKF